MIRLFVAGPEHTPLADPSGSITDNLVPILEEHHGVVRVNDPVVADAILLQEAVGFKTWRYIPQLLQDPLLGAHLAQVYTINQDDCAPGLLRGAYTSLPSIRLDPSRHVLIPYPTFPNPAIATLDPRQLGEPTLLASWRGNPRSCPRLRRGLMRELAGHSNCLIETSESWLNHGPEEQTRYLDVMAAARFSLCPRGWTPITYRIYESLACGRVPVILADGVALPQGVNWEAISLQVPERQLRQLHEILMAAAPRAAAMGRAGREAWETHYAPERLLLTCGAALMGLIRTQLGQPADHGAERRLIQSRAMARANGWTWRQRLLRRLWRSR